MNQTLEKVKIVWPEIKNIFAVPHSEKQYKQLKKILNGLIDEIGNNERHPLASLLETVGNLVDQYEKTEFKEMDASGVDVLKFLMLENGLSQKDLKELGSQGIVSEILNGKRDLNLRQIRALSVRFGVSPNVFI